MSKQPYNWIPGDPPPRIGRHSLAKHEILKSYLEKYVAVLTARLPPRKFKLTLVDGFAGGGVYLHPDADTLVYGSPFIMLDAMSSAARIG